MEVHPDAVAAAAKPSRYAWYVGWMMMLVTVISMLDRKALVMLAEPIRRELHLSDTQLGLLTGGLFSLVYALGGFPLARLADRFSRVRIIGVCLIVWSLLTAAGGFATGFLTLAMSRVGVAFGESGASPASHALLTNYFPPSARGRAYSLILAGAPLGILLGLGLGGLLNDMFNWRTALVVIGLPGVLVGIIVIFSIKDLKAPIGALEGKKGGFVLTVKQILSDAMLRNLLVGAATLFIGVGATNALFPAYIMRSFNASASMVGLGYGIVLGIAGFTGSLVGGWLSDRIGLGRRWRPLYLFAFVLPVVGILAMTRLQIANYHAILAIVGVETFLTALYAGPTFTALQSRVSDAQRAMGTAVLLFAMNGIGAALGPVLAGAISDFSARGGSNPAESLQIGLLCVVPAAFLSCFFYFRAAHHYRCEEEASGRTGHAIAAD